MDVLIHHPLIHKKCHPNSHHSDITYHVTLNIIFSVDDTQPKFSILFFFFPGLSVFSSEVRRELT